MLAYLLFCLSVFLYEANGRPPNDGQLSRPAPLDRFGINRTCRRPLVTGNQNCRSKLKRWYYDSSSETCKLFVWSGCGGNDNRFESREECENRCGGVLPCRSSRARPAPKGCTIFTAIDISEGCPVYHWDCQDALRTSSCPPAIDIGPIPKDCSIMTIRTLAGCSKDIVTCSGGN